MNKNIKNKPYILIVNDDGIFSPGLAALCDALDPIGELLIVAPNMQQTSMGRSYPKNNDLGIIKRVTINTKQNTFFGYSINASPAYAIAYATKEISNRKIDLCVSGINYGENLGKTITYSGTIGATLQAADFDIPSIAISRPALLEHINSDKYHSLDWTLSKNVIAFWVNKVLKEGFPFDCPIININVPEKINNIYEFKYTFQSKKELFEFEKAKKRDYNKPYMIPSKKRINFKDIEIDSDIYTVCVKSITSVTPIEGDLTFNKFLV